MPRSTKKSKKTKTPYQGIIYLYEPDEESEGEETASISLLVHAAAILELARQIEAGEVELTDRGQVKFGGRLYEAEDASYFESGMVWAQTIERNEWPEIVEEFDELDLEKPARKKTRSSSTSRKTRGQTRSRR